VNLTSPTAGSTLGSSITFAATASDDRGVARVEFWVDSTLVGTDTSSPYRIRRKVSGLSAGPHTVTARAFDTAGQAASSAVAVSAAGASVARAARAVAARAGQRGISVTTAPRHRATRVIGVATPRARVRVTLTRCGDTRGRTVARLHLRADRRGRVAGSRPRAGLCVLRLERMRR
jgi:hypothetical protein